VAATVRDIREETGIESEVVDLVGLYHLTGNGCGEGLPDVFVHVFRARLTGGEAAVNAPGRIRRLAWFEQDSLPQPMTATTRTAITDALSGRTGVIRDVQRDEEPDVPEAVETDLQGSPRTIEASVAAPAQRSS
jgi:8-oxo-dGTP diphosphatase